MSKLSITLSGSFRRNPDKLKQLYTDLKSKFEVLSPVSIDWVSADQGFVKTAKQQKQSILEVESGHLQAITHSDLLIFHAPDGYVGLSGSLEIGFAHALGIPILADSPPSDATLAALISGIYQPQAKAYPTVQAGQGVAGLQRYYKRIADRRGWSAESARDTLLLMTEEVGELARAVRKHAGLKRDAGYDDVAIADELADVQLYLVHLANSLAIELSEAVTSKEAKNAERFSKKTS